MHTLVIVACGLVALGIFVLAALLLGRGMADGARVFVWPWLVVSLINMLIGLYGAGVPLSIELSVLVIVFGGPAAVAWFVARKFRRPSQR